MGGYVTLSYWPQAGDVTGDVGKRHFGFPKTTMRVGFAVSRGSCASMVWDDPDQMIRQAHQLLQHAHRFKAAREQEIREMIAERQEPAELCSACSGSGEGPADGTRCHDCRGSGEVAA